MKHAGAATLAQLAPLLKQLRAIEGLVERRPGIFYLRGRAFLHFHEDPAGPFADVRLNGGEFQRFALPLSEFEPFVRRVAAAVEVLTARRSGRDGKGQHSTRNAGGVGAGYRSSDPRAGKEEADEFGERRPPRDGRKV